MDFADTLQGLKIKARNYKCIGPDLTGFDVLKPTNIIVGRNNSGKSALLDVIKLACSYGKLTPDLQHKGKFAELVLCKKLTENEIGKAFRPRTSGGPIPGRNDHFRYASPRLLGKEITFKIEADNSHVFLDVESDDIIKLQNIDQYLATLGKSAENPGTIRLTYHNASCMLSLGSGGTRWRSAQIRTFRLLTLA